MLTKNEQQIKNNVLAGAKRLPYRDYIKVRTNYWVKEIATEQELLDLWNLIKDKLVDLRYTPPPTP